MNLTEIPAHDYSKEFIAYGEQLTAGKGMPWPDRPKLIGRCLFVIIYLLAERDAMLKRIEKLEKKK